ncbi:MAG: hypothetical protein AAF763_07460, partial [Pseudomonadota bacterium]
EELAAERAAREAAEAELAAMRAAPKPAAAPASGASGDAELLEVENAALRKALAEAEARAKAG